MNEELNVIPNSCFVCICNDLSKIDSIVLNLSEKHDVDFQSRTSELHRRYDCFIYDVGEEIKFRLEIFSYKNGKHGINLHRLKGDSFFFSCFKLLFVKSLSEERVINFPSDWCNDPLPELKFESEEKEEEEDLDKYLDPIFSQIDSKIDLIRIQGLESLAFISQEKIYHPLIAKRKIFKWLYFNSATYNRIILTIIANLVVTQESVRETCKCYLNYMCKFLCFSVKHVRRETLRLFRNMAIAYQEELHEFAEQFKSYRKMERFQDRRMQEYISTILEVTGNMNE